MSTTQAPKFDLSNFQALFEQYRDGLVFMAKTAETAERYEDMCVIMRALVEWTNNNGKVDLTVEERNLLSVAFKNVVGARRASWRTLNVDDRKDDQLIIEYKKQVEAELEAICQDVLDLLENILVVNVVEEGEARVFYLKMAGDYYRYMSEFMANKEHEIKAAEFYKNAMQIAEVQLQPTHPIRLGLALNYSVCFYEILKDKKAACDLAKSAFDQAISRLDKLDEASYKDSTLIMQLLRDNLTLWTSDENLDGDEGVQVEDIDETDD